MPRQLKTNLKKVGVSILDGSTEAWDNYVLNHFAACNYHQAKWKTVIEQSFGHKTWYLQAMSGDSVVGILPLVVMKSLLFGRFMVSLPFFNYGGILADHGDAEQMLMASAQAIAGKEKANYIELRHVIPHHLGLRAKRHKVTMILDLEPNVEAQWRKFDVKLRNQIRKAGKSSLKTEVGGGALLGNFYSVFARSMRDLGTPVYGLPFFKAILTELPSSTKVFLVRLGDKPVAAGLVSTFKDTVEMPWAASLREHRSLCSNMLLYWETIKFAIHQGFSKFDFGRCTPGEGPYRFKEQWGARPVPLSWEYWLADAGELPDISPKNRKYEFPIRIWKQLPMSVANGLGPYIARAIP